MILDNADDIAIFFLQILIDISPIINKTEPIKSISRYLSRTDGLILIIFRNDDLTK
jgi:hypothetical protein